jgi:hypothetical protein
MRKSTSSLGRASLAPWVKSDLRPRFEACQCETVDLKGCGKADIASKVERRVGRWWVGGEGRRERLVQQVVQSAARTRPKREPL